MGGSSAGKSGTAKAKTQPDVDVFYRRVFALYSELGTRKARFAALTGWHAAEMTKLERWHRGEDRFSQLPQTLTVLGIAAGTETSLDELLSGFNAAYDAQVAARRQREAEMAAQSGQHVTAQEEHLQRINDPLGPKSSSPQSGAVSSGPSTTYAKDGSPMTPRQRLETLCMALHDDQIQDAISYVAKLNALPMGTPSGRGLRTGGAGGTGQ